MRQLLSSISLVDDFFFLKHREEELASEKWLMGVTGFF